MELPSTRTTSWIQSGRVLKTYGRFSASFIAGMTTLTGGAMARWEEIGRYLPTVEGAEGSGRSSLEVAGCRTELMSLVPLVRWTARPWAARIHVRFERGVSHPRPHGRTEDLSADRRHGMAEDLSAHAG
ncbi:hypothetical protein ALMP_28480 [Streptomyces sp. A012304]|nr:hypothetical protein ALMP_28480 [Streptomyces sp. A012304]